jgi:hypothetical protein
MATVTGRYCTLWNEKILELSETEGIWDESADVMPLPQIALDLVVSIAVSIVQFDQMNWVPISASSRFGILAERFL